MGDAYAPALFNRCGKATISTIPVQAGQNFEGYYVAVMPKVQVTPKIAGRCIRRAKSGNNMVLRYFAEQRRASVKLRLTKMTAPSKNETHMPPATVGPCLRACGEGCDTAKTEMDRRERLNLFRNAEPDSLIVPADWKRHSQFHDTIAGRIFSLQRYSGRERRHGQQQARVYGFQRQRRSRYDVRRVNVNNNKEVTCCWM